MGRTLCGTLLRGYCRVLCLCVACERDLKALSRLNRSQHVTHHRLHNGTILAARARAGAGVMRAAQRAPQRTAKRRGAIARGAESAALAACSAARPHPPGSAAARLLAARPELEPDRLVGVVRLWEKEKPEGAGLICVPYTPGGRSSCGRSSQRRQPLFAPLRGARPSRAARPCSASV